MELYKLKIMNKIVLPGKCLHVACHQRCVCVLSEKKKENDFPSDERSEVEGKWHLHKKKRLPTFL